jgi:hypothetical protein
VLTLGILYHLAKPVEALERTKAMSRDHVLLDTQITQSPTGPSDVPVPVAKPR